MTRASTPPTANRASRQTNHGASPPTPEITRRIEENRLRAKALRERSIAAEAAAAAAATAQGPPSLKRTRSGANGGSTTASVLVVPTPATARDARSTTPRTERTAFTTTRLGSHATTAPAADAAIEPARKFRKFVDHDFSKMTDTKGGFLHADDDPWNKSMLAASSGSTGPSGAAAKPEHMTLKEWERMQLLRGLRRRKDGIFEPGLSVLDGDDEEEEEEDEEGDEGARAGHTIERKTKKTRRRRKKCRECGSLEIDWVWEEVFACEVCHACKERIPEKYSLLTKTECKDDYLLTDPELKDTELLPHLSKPNPHKSHWHDMMLFLRYQVEEYAFSARKWGSAEALDAEFARREADKKTRKEAKFRSRLEELKKKTRTDAYMRGLRGEGRGGQFGDQVGGLGRHEHEWGRAVVNDAGMSVKTCSGCGMEVEELEL